MNQTTLNAEALLPRRLDFELPGQYASLKADVVANSLYSGVGAYYLDAKVVGHLGSSYYGNALANSLYGNASQFYSNLYGSDILGLGSIKQSFEKYYGATIWNILDKYWDKFLVVENSAFDLQTTIKIIRNEKAHRTSNQRVQAIKAALGLNNKIVKGLYYAILRELKSLLSSADYLKIKRDLAGHIASMQDTFSELTGKLKSVARLVSSVGYTIDKRSESRKKLKVALRQSDDEDSFLR